MKRGTVAKQKSNNTNRVIRIIGEINYESLKTFSEELETLESQSDQTITIELCSEGGDTYAGLGFYSKIKNSKSFIRIEAYGCIMSAATIILAAGDRRAMHADAWLMVHDDSQHVDAPNGKIAVSEAQHLDDLENHWAEILARHSHTEVTATVWRKLSAKTTYLSAPVVKGMGLVHEIY